MSIESAEDDEILEEIRKDDSKDNFNSVINRKNVSKWELDQAFAGEA